MLTNILIIVGALIAVFLVIVALQPSAFRVARSAVIDAPAGEVFPHVNDLHNWQDWSPYEGRDPAMKRTFEGPRAGTGASYAWSGNNQVGQGRMTITESRSNERITIRLEFLKPFKCTNTAEFLFKPQGERTEVTWALCGNKSFMSKAFCMVMSMDKMVGGDFEKGLAKLKSVVESAPVAAATR